MPPMLVLSIIRSMQLFTTTPTTIILKYSLQITSKGGMLFPTVLTSKTKMT